MTANPDVFNKGQLNAPGPSAGPFIVSTIDRTAQRIVLTRNPAGGVPSRDSTPSHFWCSMPPPSFPPCKTTLSTPPV
ncbi:hypothetical protein I553_9615 [Mycobacterium xenopi 4042]|uniref:Uncharacterized protein n=1 Tax=Mycobacterium xenopi 4042 TaxID=1299334 RepID=X8DYK0_MYCXE|nr:hypothetical protein I553_9615 [Mycobacterium xenopi 4042]